MLFPGRFVLLDTEFTADEDSKRFNWSRPGEFKEIIQVGAILVSGHALTVAGSLKLYVRPRLQPTLSEFIKELTGIRQEDVDFGVSLEHAVSVVKAFAGGQKIYCYGTDGDVIAENCKLDGCVCPAEFLFARNLRPMLKPILADMKIDMEQYSSGTLLQAFGLTGGREHDALNDMENLLMVLQELRKNGRL